jgi:hypothetical protein
MEANRFNLIKILLFITILSSCSKEKEKNFYELYSINSKKKEDKIQANYYIYFAKNTQNQICIIKLHEILYPYEKNNITVGLDSHFNDILNQKDFMQVDSTDHVCFTMDKKIEKDYLNLERKEFVDKFTLLSKNKKDRSINYKLESDQILNVAYFMFRHGFKITFNDYLGTYYVDDLEIH